MSMEDAVASRKIEIERGLERDVAEYISQRVRLSGTFHRPHWALRWLIEPHVTITGPASAVEKAEREIKAMNDEWYKENIAW